MSPEALDGEQDPQPGHVRCCTLRWVRDSQSGMWVFERSSLREMDLVSDGMAFSEEIKIEAIRKKRIGFKEIYVDYSNRMGEIKLQSLEGRIPKPPVPRAKTARPQTCRRTAGFVRGRGE